MKRWLARLRRIFFATWWQKAGTILGLILLAVIFGHVVPRVTAVAAVQNAVERNWEITFNTWHEARYLPKGIDDAVEKFLADRYEHRRGADNRDLILMDRFRAPFHGPIRKIEINYFYNFNDDLGPALQRFPKLNELRLNNNKIFAKSFPPAGEESVDLLFREISELKELRILALEGVWVTDQAVRHLDSLPLLEELSLTNAFQISSANFETFQKLPKLEKLALFQTGISNEDALKLAEMLPHVEILHVAISP